jgi:tripartite-type tricarboxylate transporter receptor subunit TctC
MMVLAPFSLFAQQPKVTSLTLISGTASPSSKELAQHLSRRLPELLKKPVNLKSLPSGTGVPAAGLLTQAPADGSTLGILPLEASITRILTQSTPYLASELTGLLILYEEPYALIASSHAPFDNLSQLAAQAQKTPLTLGYNSPTGLSLPILQALSVSKQMGFELKAKFSNALTPESLINDSNIDLMLVPLSETFGLLQKGVKVVAVLADDFQRQCAPNIESLSDLGLKIEIHNFTAIYGPAFLPLRLSADALDHMLDLLNTPEASAIMERGCLTRTDYNSISSPIALAQQYEAHKNLLKSLGMDN